MHRMRDKIYFVFSEEEFRNLAVFRFDNIVKCEAVTIGKILCRCFHHQRIKFTFEKNCSTIYIDPKGIQNLLKIQ